MLGTTPTLIYQAAQRNSHSVNTREFLVSLRFMKWTCQHVLSVPVAQSSPSGRGIAVLCCLAGGLRLTAGAGLFLLGKCGKCQTELWAWWEKKDFNKYCRVGFTKGGEKRGKAGESVTLIQWFVMCFVISDGQLVKAELLWGSSLLLSCMNTPAGNSPLWFPPILIGCC